MYKKTSLPFEKIPQLSQRDKAYQQGDEALKPFYKYEPNLASFREVVAAKSKQAIDRSLLVNELKKQYEGVSGAQKTLQQINRLSEESTYTVVTAHQPSLLTGPLYFLYKVCSILSLSEQLNNHYSDFYTIPVFILGGEDHDFEEIATMHLFGQEYTWETKQLGSTGRMNLDGIREVLDQVIERLGDSDNATDLKSKLNEAFDGSASYGQFMFQLVHSLFGDYGLVILNMDNPSFKEKLLPFIIKDIEDEDSQRLVISDQERLEEVGFKGQAYARNVNAFWMDEDRHRIIDHPDGQYEINGSYFNREELVELMRKKPGAVSPNVILRPVYQEVILPNLAYIGGGGELAYWLERKSLFEHWSIPFPMLIRRDSVLIIDKRSYTWLTSAGLDIEDLFEREEQIVGKYAQLQAPVDIDLTEESKTIHTAFERIKALAAQVDPTLKKTVLSEEAKTQKSLSYLENKILKAEKQKNEVGINKLKKTKQKFFPGNDGLQERYDNFISFYLKYGQAWIDYLVQHLDPLDKEFKIFIEE